MGLTLQDTLNFCETYIEYSPLSAGTNFNPAVTIASMVRSTILNSPLIWPWNRAEFPITLIPGQQDYVFDIDDFAYLEKISLLSSDGATPTEIQDIHNTNILGISATVAGSRATPNSAAVKYYTPCESVAIRFLSTPDDAYTGSITYQKLAVPFTVFDVESVSVISGVVYYTFLADQCAAEDNKLIGQDIQVQGFLNAVNNGTFTVVASTATYLILANPLAIDEVAAATAINIDWFPIPDSYADIFMNLFLAEAMAVVDDAREQLYRARGVGALLSKAEGLTEMQINTFLAQAMARGTSQELAAQLRVQQGHAGRQQ